LQKKLPKIAKKFAENSKNCNKKMQNFVTDGAGKANKLRITGEKLQQKKSILKRPLKI